MTAQDEAIENLATILADLGTANHDLKAILQRCYHVSNMLGWTDARDRFYRELYGYPDLDSVPDYRRVPGRLVWRPSAGFYVVMEKAVEDQLSSRPDDPGEPATLAVWAEIDWLLGVAQTGYTETTGETRQEYLRLRRTNITMERARLFDAAAFKRAVHGIEGHVYTWASQQYALLKYGNALSDVWHDYRTSVDAALAHLNVTKHWQAIEAGLRSDNPESWRNAVFGCRNLLTDLAQILWQDPRPTYEHLKNPQGQDLDVRADKFANRLAAYAHQKGLTGTRGKYMRDEVERLAASLRSVIAFQGEAHQSISRDDARAVALGTHYLVAQLVIRTDMNPVLEYGQPAT